MLAGDVLAVLLFLVGLAAAIGVAAYSLSGTKARNLWLMSVIVALTAMGWMWWHIRFDAARVYQLLITAMPVIVITLVVMIVRNHSSDEQHSLWPEGLARKRNLIDSGRRLASIYAQGRTGQDSFRQYIEMSPSYAALRGHLDPAYLSKLNDGRTVYASSPGARYEPLVQWFLDELDRLERAWGLA